ncbi:hypothetical protein AWC38_SpisGene24381 [Stylophora pistillata]|uniref:SCAN box domain-containing protein n=1 Tax=Stylophora pistillata TaxID=50429 RepID=A0A2B4R3Q2_STYPI|nr:hypothetical protein AWC38_SpisGene24381 [Stylophora pistillata]
MTDFDPEKFMSEPCEDTFYDLKKDELISLGKHLELEVKKAMRKHQTQDIIVKHLVSLQVFEETVLEAFETSDSELKKLQLQWEFKKLEMQEEREMRLKIVEMERQERREEMERKERLERKERQERLEKEKLAFQHEMEMNKLEVQIQLGLVSGSEKHRENFDVTKHIRLVPPFQETDVDKYFLHFEKVAESLKWPKEYWAMLLQSVLLEFARTKEQLFDRWCSSQKVNKDHDRLRQVVLIEEFKRCILSDVRTFINEQKAETLEEAARLADDYSLTHKVVFEEKPSGFTSSRPDANRVKKPSEGEPKPKADVS